MKDNYYDATHEHTIKKTGECIFKTPVYMQREPAPTDKEFIQVGVECYFRHPTRAEAKEGKGNEMHSHISNTARRMFVSENLKAIRRRPKPKHLKKLTAN